MPKHLCLLLIFSFLVSCKIIVSSTAYGVHSISEHRDTQKLKRINKKFDNDGWYRYSLSADASTIYTLFRKKDSAALAPFYGDEEFNFLRKNLQLKSGLKDTFECFDFHRTRLSVDFSSTRDCIYLRDDQPKHDFEFGYQCYVRIAPDTFACLLLSEHQLLVPYLLITAETAIALPKRYVPPTNFDSYRDQLIDFDALPNSDVRIRVNGSKKRRIDTTAAFRIFIRNHPFENQFALSPQNIDTTLYDLNHKIRYHTIEGNAHQIYRRYFFAHFNTIGALYHTNYNDSPATSSNLHPELKMYWKKRLDAYFDDLLSEK